MGDRRQELAEQATDYALEHGLIGLSLRPLAQALGTSDRMLLYHFTDKDDLVATRPPDLQRPLDLRHPARCRPRPTPAGRCSTCGPRVSEGEQARCARIYVEASALGVLGAGAVRRAWPRSATGPGWTRWPTTSPAPAYAAPAAARAAALVDAAFMGLHLDQQLDDGAARRRTVADLAAAVGARPDARAARGYAWTQDRGHEPQLHRAGTS